MDLTVIFSCIFRAPQIQIFAGQVEKAQEAVNTRGPEPEDDGSLDQEVAGVAEVRSPRAPLLIRSSPLEKTESEDHHFTALR